MRKTQLYIAGGFDVLHQDHKSFIRKGIKIFREKYGPLDRVIFGLLPDSFLAGNKGVLRPFFCYSWRKEDIAAFLDIEKVNFEIIPQNQFTERFAGHNNIVAQINSEERDCQSDAMPQFESMGIPVQYVGPFNSVHTSTIEERLFGARARSNCNLRKVGALLIREGRVIAEGYSGSGDCECCSKYLVYKKGGGTLSQHVPCDSPHAEVMALQSAEKGDDLLITDSPCRDCVELIADKGVQRVVYVAEYWDVTPIETLKSRGIKVRKSGYRN